MFEHLPKHIMFFKQFPKLSCTYPLILIFFCLLNLGSQSQDTVFPVLTISRLSNQWKNVSLSTLHKPGIYDQYGGDLFLKCNAPYPIEWNLSGYLSPVEVVQMRPPTVDVKTNSFEIKVDFFFLKGRKFTELGASFRISCTKRGSFQIRDDLYVFVLGNNTSSLISPVSSTLLDSRLLPCLTKDPTKIPTLTAQTTNSNLQAVSKFFQGSKELVGNSNITYHPTEGFHSDKVFNGEYFCEQGSTVVRFQARSTLTQFRNPKFDFYPRTDGVIKVYADQPITFRCSSKLGQAIKMISDDEEKFFFSRQNSSAHTQVVIITAKSNTNFSKTGEIFGKLICITDLVSDDNIEQNEIAKEWFYEFVKPPELFVDNYAGSASCLSQAQQKLVQTVRCRNTMHCKFMSQCLSNPTHCNFQNQKQFYSDSTIRCWVPRLRRGRNCVSVKYAHFNGLAQCSQPGNLMRSWEFFVSLDFLRYSNWKDASERELVRMDEVSPILYTNNTNSFFCMAVAYLFADSLSFEIEYGNGSRLLLSHNGESVNISNPGEGHPRKIDEFNVIGELSIYLSVDVTMIHCLAPWWNDSSVLSTSRKFETKHLLQPRFLDGDNLPKGSTAEKVEFYVGKEHQRLSCHAEGEPQPDYKWYFISENRQLATDVFKELKTSFGSDGENNLEFPLLFDDDKRFEGTYQCVVSNRVGSVERIFSLEVLSESVSSLAMVYIITILVIVAILVVVLGLLVVYMRQFKKARDLVRNLTDREVDEFFSGKPELVSNLQTNGISSDVVEFLPFNVEYEIPYDDLMFDLSEANMLGSGHFSFVVRGKIKSQNKAVAIKLCKSSADVTIFKSLLSEIKIMAYIGTHENVMALVGVCTESIRHRSIYIATDICELGSLNIFLRNARSSFVNIMLEDNETNSCATDINKETSISILDLISFSYQIAKGMEYLSSMSIIHADLAARNVLLTGEKIVKISDFGLSKKLYQDNNYVKKSKSPLPWRWMALESLNTLTFSTSSDVWAYGVTMYEIFTLGDTPFPNEEWSLEFVSRLANGMRMGRPKYSTTNIYSMICACWEMEPNERPGFTTIRLFFEELLHEVENLPRRVNTRSTDTKACSYYVNIPTSSLSGNSNTGYENVNCA